ncbi:hypothetical protein B0G81_6037 [Paraburkholderia sp. BL6665CI2N2]|uniref:hypothetical protein n=1 Tax=Paraburkholderia sp. BL6665CI2N2 TaxID=1938806 RepID=UPI001065E7B1|nr:hypothetical protein [Paraburkholderia sp. BL6665CI2N2]TDY25559.1 hypothetical protein B0G81_6037 [Paraburkholderia sp. BL6665CI2N2]
MSDKNYKKELMFRRAQGRLVVEEYSRKLAHLLNHHVRSEAFLDLKKTDEIIDKLSNKTVNYSDNAQIGSENEMVHFIKRKVGRSGFYVLIDEAWKFCGAYKVDGGFELNSNFNFNENLSDEIRIIDVDLLFQIQIDYDFNEITCLYLEY